MSSAVDEKFYQAVHPGSISERILLRARDKIYAEFLSQMAPSEDSSIIDVGVSDVINEGANVLEREYPYPHRITACGLGEAGDFRAAYPHCAYHRIVPNEPLPFADNTFSIATANAVLEHVGSIENQVNFLRQLCRVAEKVFISVPNRYFPIEHHTSLPLVHYSDSTFYIACRFVNKHEWTEEQNLIMITYARLRRLAQTCSKRATLGYTGIRLGPFSSNLFLTLRS